LPDGHQAKGVSSHWHLVPTVSGTPVHQEPFTRYTAWMLMPFNVFASTPLHP
jgi:hypothetical protein